MKQKQNHDYDFYQIPNHHDHKTCRKSGHILMITTC